MELAKLKKREKLKKGFYIGTKLKLRVSSLMFRIKKVVNFVTSSPLSFCLNMLVKIPA